MANEYAGMHWPNGAEDFNRIMALPSPLILMLATEARFHANKVRNAGKTVIWRGLPRVGKRPAELGWNVQRSVDEALNLWGENGNYADYFVPFNELDLNYERGDNENDFSNLSNRYSFLGNFLHDVGVELRTRLPYTYLLFPPFTPDHGDWENLDRWRHALTHYNGLVIHAYENANSSLDDVYNRIRGYCLEFPDKTIFVGEWNTETNVPEFLRVLDRCQKEFSNFGGATYFIWHWYNAPGYWPDRYNVDRNGELYTIFQNPPKSDWEPSTPVEPTPVPTPQPEPVPDSGPRPYTQDEVVQVAKEVANEVGLPARLLVALLDAESSLRWNAARYAYRNGDGSYTNLTQRAEAAIQRGDHSDLAGVLVEISNNNSNDVSFGVGQQTVRWATEGTHELTVENVLYIRDLYYRVPFATRVAARQLKVYYDMYHDDLEALCRYNKPSVPGWQNPNRNNYNNGLNRADELLGVPQEPTVPEVPQGDVVASYKESNVAGAFMGMPKGVILHGSRSGVRGNPKHSEFVGTSNWAASNPDGLGWNATIGENEYCMHMNIGNWGWNARVASKNYIGVEFAQATVDEPITDAQVHAFVAFFKREILPVWPSFPLYFPTHAEVEASGETGARDGKTDVFPFRSAETDELRARIMNALTTDVPTPTPNDGGLTVDEREELNQLRNIHGYVTHDVPAIIREKVLNKPLKKKPLKKDLEQYIADIKSEAQAVAETLERQ